jgi:predicted SPOUT superfamily RNA methylase MTH1
MNILPCRRSKGTLTVAIPASILSLPSHFREKTALAGFVGRVATIFRVDRILVYRDLASEDQTGDARLLVKILQYLDTPQYLRRLVYPIDDDLRYVGILPPLRGPHHPLPQELEQLSPGDLREGVVVDSRSGESQVDIGLETPVPMIDPLQKVGRRVTVKILRGGPDYLVRLALPEEIRSYWGYTVSDCAASLGGLLSGFRFDLVIATSREGESWTRVAKEIGRRIAGADSTLLLFGSHRAGLREILSHENLKLKDIVEFTVNTIPSQGTATVRTEEALFASLALLRAS